MNVPLTDRMTVRGCVPSFQVLGMFRCVFYCTKISSEPRQDVEQRYNTFRPAAVIEIIFCILLYREGREKLFLGENIFAVYRRFKTGSNYIPSFCL